MSPNDAYNNEVRSNRGKRRVRFHAPCQDAADPLQNEPALILSDDEIKAMWWTRRETKQMKEAAEVEAQCSLSKAHSFVTSGHQGMTCMQPDGNIIRQIFDKSTLDDSDLDVLNRIPLKQSVSHGADPSCLPRVKAQRRRHCVRRVVQVQKFLNQRDEPPCHVANLLKVTSLYHSESSTSLAELIGKVDEIVASKAYNECANTTM